MYRDEFVTTKATLRYIASCKGSEANGKWWACRTQPLGVGVSEIWYFRADDLYFSEKRRLLKTDVFSKKYKSEARTKLPEF